MAPDDGTVYMIRGGDDEWVSPAPAEAVIVEELAEQSDLAGEDLDELASYVDIDALDAVVNGDEQRLTFTVEGHEVTVTADGDVTVEA